MMTEEQRKLAEDNLGLVYGYLNKHGLPFEEWVGTLSETLCKCAIKYSPDKGAAFSTFVFVAFDNAVRRDYRSKNLMKSIPESMIRSGNEIVFDDGKENPLILFDMLADGSDRIADMLFLNEFRKFLNGMKERDKKILMLRLNGMTDEEIGTEVGLTQSMVCRIRNRIRNRIKEEICGTS